VLKIDRSHVERLPEQLRQAAVPGAEVVHRDAHVGFAGAVQRGAAGRAQRLPLGHLANQPVEERRQSELLEHLEDLAVAHHHRRHVDADVEIGKASEQRLRVALDRLQQPPHQLLQVLRVVFDLLDQRPDRPRRAGVVRDPRQHFEPGDLARAESDDRLVVRDDALQHPREIRSPHLGAGSNS